MSGGQVGTNVSERCITSIFFSKDWRIMFHTYQTIRSHNREDHNLIPNRYDLRGSSETFLPSLPRGARTISLVCPPVLLLFHPVHCTIRLASFFSLLLLHIAFYPSLSFRTHLLLPPCPYLHIPFLYASHDLTENSASEGTHRMYQISLSSLRRL
jgi:hypothetical protein